MSERLRLELISKRAYEERERFWGDSRNNWDAQAYGCIVNPMIDASYESLIERLAETPGVFKVRVRNSSEFGPKWLGFYQDQLAGARGVIAEHARADTLKRDYLNVFLSRPVWRPEDSAVIEVAEKEGKIVCYKLFAPRVSHELFDLPRMGYVRFINGLADPSCLARIQAAREEKLVLPGDQHIARTA